MGHREDLLFPAGAQRPNRAIRVIGIDLGTTNSTIAELEWQPGQELPDVRCLEVDQITPQGRYTHVLIPSIVAVQNCQKIVGYGAKLLRSDPVAGLEQNTTVFAECKNDIGLKRTYHRASADLKSAKAVAREVLKFLYDSALKDNPRPIGQVVVTVPASFQAAQRRDTVDAAQNAGLVLSDGALFDEPLAALIDYIYHHEDQQNAILPAAGESRNVLVFDFGGGTCDVAILRIGRDANERLTVTPLSVSRYHRLGGGDIDRAIIHDVLIPQVQQQNALDEFALTYTDKIKYVQPVLLRIAEALKENLCNEISRRRRLGIWAETKPEELIQRYPGEVQIPLRDRILSFKSPSLSAKQLQDVLQPFLDPHLLAPRQDEYRITCSVFTPLVDALERADLDKSEVEICLLAGGSSLIPHIEDAVRTFFAGARMLQYRNRDDAQTAIAKGAAIQAFALATNGCGLIRSICHDDICFETQDEPVVLVSRGSALPHPSTGEYQRRDMFALAEASPDGSALIRVSLVAGQTERRALFTGIWHIPAPVRIGERLWLEYRYDENQVLSLRMGRQAEPSHVYVGEVENPFTHVVNPNKTQAEIDDIEEKLRTSGVPKEEVAEQYRRLGDLYRELRQFDKAIDFYARSMQLAGELSVSILNSMAFCCRDRRDKAGARNFFTEATNVASWSGTYINWALAEVKWGNVERALELATEASELENDPAYSIFLAQLYQKLGKELERDRLLADGLARFGVVSGLDMFELAWLCEGARMAGKTALAEEASKQLRKRQHAQRFPETADGALVKLAKGAGQ